MHDNEKSNQRHGLTRRDFIRAGATAGAGVFLAASSAGRAAMTPSDELNVVLIGAGTEGRILTESCLRIPGIRFRAVCDIWDYNRMALVRFLENYGQKANDYVDYREMLEKEKDLDAAIVATPDWMHAEHAIACMEAGLDVYCEKEMSNNLELARQMVETKNRTGRLLQIGHQRRSNPRYHHAVDNLVHGINLLGRVTHANAQWNRAVVEDIGWPKGYELDPARLAQYGYESMTQFRNWRWYKKYGGGPVVDLGSHQIDIFAWIFNANPRSVTARGGIDYYQQHEWYDNVMAVYEYEVPAGTFGLKEPTISRAFYQVLTTTAYGLFHEAFMGEDGTLVISEMAPSGDHVLREEHAPNWDVWAQQGYLVQTKQEPLKPKKDVSIDVRATLPLGSWPLPVQLAKPPHQPHLENFFDAMRVGTPLNCPAEIGYETAVAVLSANTSVMNNDTIRFKPEDFEVHGADAPTSPASPHDA